MGIPETSLLTLVMLLATITLPVPSVISQEEQEGEEEQKWLVYEDPGFGYISFIDQIGKKDTQ